MAKNSVFEWSATAANNTDVGGVGITGNSLPSNLDDAIRTLMAQVKSFQTYLGISSTGNTWTTAQTFTASNGVQLVSSNPQILFTDTDTNVDHSVSGSSSVGAFSINVDINDEGGATGRFFLNVKTIECIRVGTDGVRLGQDIGLSFQGTGASQTRTALGVPTGTSGMVLPFLDAANTWGADQSFAGSVKSTTAADGSANGFSIQAAGRNFSRSSTATQNQMNFWNPNGIVGTINTNGTSTSFNTSSDETFKIFDGFLDPDYAITVIRADPVRTWTWIPEKGGGAGMGWGAQTSYAVSPDLASPGGWVSQETGDPVEEGTPNSSYNPWGVDFSRRTPYLWAATSYLVSKIEELEARLAAIEPGA